MSATSLRIGPHVLPNNVLLAPMAGVTDAPFRAAAMRLGAGLTVAEMAAGREVVKGRHGRRLAGAEQGIRPCAVQLTGHEPWSMARAAGIALQCGADIIDINMGCPARMVTGRLSGAALMRDPQRAAAIIRAVIGVAAGAPVTLKMRLGWDETQMNAPDIACMAADLGVAMIAVHGRSRQQFYRGRADWRAVGRIVRRLRQAGHGIAIIVNGDITDAHTALTALAQSGADGVMIGRAAIGRPWLVGEIAEGLAPGTGIRPLSPARQVEEIIRLHEEMCAFHGQRTGLRRARRHIREALLHWWQAGWLKAEETKMLQAHLLREDEAAAVRGGLWRLAQRMRKREAA